MGVDLVDVLALVIRPPTHYCGRTIRGSQPQLAGRLLLMVKATVSNISPSRLGLAGGPKAFAMAYLSLVPSLLAILSSSTAHRCLLIPLLRPKLAPNCPIIHSHRQTPSQLHLIVVFHYLCARYAPPWIDVIADATDRYGDQCWPTSRVDFRPHDEQTSSSSHAVRPSPIKRFSCFRGACGSVCISAMYFSMNCCIMYMGYIILGARQRGFSLWI